MIVHPALTFRTIWVGRLIDYARCFACTLCKLDTFKYCGCFALFYKSKRKWNAFNLGSFNEP